MNKQGPKAIEWTDFTWNPVGGCHHACRWTMPDGTTARCYAEAVAEGVARNAYPDGFDAHYWNPDRLEEPLRRQQPARIFLDSMSDLMGHWVPNEQIRAVLDVVRRADWHTFQLLTKNAPRLLQFRDELPFNLWVGVSSPPDEFMGKPLGSEQKKRYLYRALDVLDALAVEVVWISFEPLSFDVAGEVLSPWCGDRQARLPLNWAVIGAASNGAQYHQPDPDHLARLETILDGQRIPVFYKGNLSREPWREEFPRDRHSEPVQLGLDL